MVTQSVLTNYLHELLQPEIYKDFCPNGLQVAGQETIHHIITGVTLCQELIEIAIQEKAQGIIVHHGLLWQKESLCIVGMKQQRLKALLTHDINLYAYHLPLDGHSSVGNNVQLAHQLGINNIKPLAIQPYSPPLIYEGTWNCSLAQAAETITTKLQRSPLVIPGGTHAINKIAWCTGAAQDGIESALAAGMDAYLSGEVSERTTHIAREGGIHYLAAGHHATERYGIQALGKQLADVFNLTHQFIEISNPV